MTYRDGDDLWVFGYGSLLWAPCFAPCEQVHARLDGWRRSFCMWSIHHRGTAETPGLVLALDAAPTSGCDGVAFRMEAKDAPDALAELRARELVSSAYREVWLPVRLRDGRDVSAVTYVISRDHAQYAAHLTLTQQAEIIARAHGGRGANSDYLLNTVAHLHKIGLRDAELEELAERLETVAKM